MAQLPAKKGADSLYYRRYLSDLNDGYINEGFKFQKKRKSDACQTTINESFKGQRKWRYDRCQVIGKSNPNKKGKVPPPPTIYRKLTSFTISTVAFLSVLTIVRSSLDKAMRWGWVIGIAP